MERHLLWTLLLLSGKVLQELRPMSGNVDEPFESKNQKERLDNIGGPSTPRGSWINREAMVQDLLKAEKQENWSYDQEPLQLPDPPLQEKQHQGKVSRPSDHCKDQIDS